MGRIARACASPVEDLFLESLLILAGIIGVVVFGIVTGTIDTFYADVTELTSDGVPWTEVMQQNPWIWPVGSVIALYIVATVATITRRSARTARLWLSAIALGLGFLGGHIYWPAA